MIVLTQSAASALQSAMAGATNPIAGLRLDVESGGCAGFKYKMGLVPEAAAGDLEIESAGIKVFLAPDSAERLAGVTVDFVVNADGAGFTFDNPAAAKSCSCGKSFG
jgi:iron-sulfur cluster assembly protein